MRGEERSPQGGGRRESVNSRAGHKILRGSLRGCRSPRLPAASYQTVPFYHASVSWLFPPSAPVLSAPLQPLASPVTQPVPPAPRHPHEGMQNRRSFKSAGEPGPGCQPPGAEPFKPFRSIQAWGVGAPRGRRGTLGSPKWSLGARSSWKDCSQGAS